MATLLFTGIEFELVWFNGRQIATGLTSTQQEIAVSGDSGTISHVPNQPRPLTNIVNASEIGPSFPGAYRDPSFFFREFIWGTSSEFSTIVMLREVREDANTHLLSYFEISGDPLPEMDSTSDLDRFIARVESIETAQSFENVFPASAVLIRQNDTFFDYSDAPSTFLGGVGGDTFVSVQSLGADTYIGGDDFDVLWFSDGSRNNPNPISIRLDLLNPQLNTASAAGDTYESIEAIFGSDFAADNLAGDHADNWLIGDRAILPMGPHTNPDWFNGETVNEDVDPSDLANMGDWLYGRGGDDVLWGGAGRDNLVGGQGADQFWGGSQFDTVRYSNWQPLLLDLENGQLNSAEAQGDTFNSIERIIASSHDDIMRGDNGATEFFGEAGNDILRGRAGDDFLHGQAGNDQLAGGAHNDTLRGGQGSDTFIFNDGDDVIEDFTSGVDRLHLVASQLGIMDQTIVEILNSSSMRDGDVVLHFGDGHSLTLNGVSDAQTLLDDLVLL